MRLGLDVNKLNIEDERGVGWDDAYVHVNEMRQDNEDTHRQLPWRRSQSQG